MRQVIYMAHPVAPTEDEIAAIPMEIVQAGVGEYEFDLRLPRSLADRITLAIKANIKRALRWLSWLRRSFPEITFIAPWIVGIMSGEDDSDPAQREAGLVDACAVVERCDGIVMVGGRIGTGGARERDHGVNSAFFRDSMSHAEFDVYDLTDLGPDVPGMMPVAAHPGLMALGRLKA